jgi:hypothetical protein
VVVLCRIPLFFFVFTENKIIQQQNKINNKLCQYKNKKATNTTTAQRNTQHTKHTKETEQKTKHNKHNKHTVTHSHPLPSLNMMSNMIGELRAPTPATQHDIH